jgi:hypothetical protein
MNPNSKNKPGRPGDDLEAIDKLGPTERSSSGPNTLANPIPASENAPRESGPSLAGVVVANLAPDVLASLEFDDAGGAPCRLSKTVTVIGRAASGADVVLPWNEDVSREHAAILYLEGEFFLEDLQSINGTFVNDQRAQRVRLHSGDKIRIGTQVLTFKLRVQV